MPTPSPNQIVALGSGAVEISLGVQLIPLCRRTSGELSHTIVHQRYFHQAAHNRADRCANMQDRIFRPSVGGGRSGGKEIDADLPRKNRKEYNSREDARD